MNLRELPIIGFCGYAGAGKSFTAHYLADQMDVAGIPVEVISFAEPIKDMVIALMEAGGMDRHAIMRAMTTEKEAPLDLFQGRSPRFLMQTVGTEWGRTIIGHNIWTDLLVNRAKELLDQGIKVLVDDVRFTSETDAIVNLGGQVILINNPRTGPGPHVSEHLPPHHATIQNDPEGIMEVYQLWKANTESA